MDFANALYIVFVLLVGVLVADLALLLFLAVIDRLDPSWLKRGWHSIEESILGRFYVAPGLESQVKRSGG